MSAEWFVVQGAVDLGAINAALRPNVGQPVPRSEGVFRLLRAHECHVQEKATVGEAAWTVLRVANTNEAGAVLTGAAEPGEIVQGALDAMGVETLDRTTKRRALLMLEDLAEKERTS